MAQNRYYSSLTRRTNTTVDPGTSGTTLTVTDTSSFSVLDSTFPYTLLINWGQSDQEIVNVTARPSGTTFTIVRAQDGTTGQAHATGATVDHGMSARDLGDAASHQGSTGTPTTAGVHGVSGNVVGDTDTQTLTNKTLTTPTISSFVNAAHDHHNAAGGGLFAAPALSAYRNAALSLTGTSYTVLGWDAEAYQDNVAANAMHNNSTNNTRLIAPSAGKYALVASVEMQTNAAAPYLVMYAQSNGTTILHYTTEAGVASQTNQITLTTVEKMAANDYLEIFLKSTVSGHALQVGSTTCYVMLTFLSA